MTKGVTAPKEKDFSTWYQDVILKAGLIEYSLVSGCMVIRPYAYRMWELLRDALDSGFKERGVENAYFPLLIPESLLKKEQEHVEGFNPEVAWVTETGDTKLPERLAIRPTSETIMYDSYRKWIRSHRDLPLLINQWNNVVRWEFKHPVPFLRTREFLWQEGHTCFATKKEADKDVHAALDLYEKVFVELMAIPVLKGIKSDKEKFAGADYTTSLETIFPNGKAIQGCTSHALGQNFSKAFDISFQDENEKKAYVWQNSWGFTTRTIGILLGVHGDDKGLVLPPKIAPIQAVIVPIYKSDDRDKVLKEANLIFKSIKDIRAKLDDRDEYSPGFKFNEWELKGVPVRVEIGPKDIEKKQCVLVRRDTGAKEAIALKDAPKKIGLMLEDIQDNLYKKASKFLKDHIVDVKSLAELKKAVETGNFGKADWCGSPKCEEVVKDKTGAKSLNSSFDSKPKGKCVFCGEKAQFVTHFGRSY
ncbi:MAG: proline--tRNA ligase [Candidatus Woesearchaeota archaeon]